MEVSGQPAPSALAPGKNSDTYWTGGWVGLRAGLDVLEKRKISWSSQDSNLGLSSP